MIIRASLASFMEPQNSSENENLCLESSKRLFTNEITIANEKSSSQPHLLQCAMKTEKQFITVWYHVRMVPNVGNTRMLKVVVGKLREILSSG